MGPGPRGAPSISHRGLREQAQDPGEPLTHAGSMGDPRTWGSPRPARTAHACPGAPSCWPSPPPTRALSPRARAVVCRGGGQENGSGSRGPSICGRAVQTPAAAGTDLEDPVLSERGRHEGHMSPSPEVPRGVPSTGMEGRTMGTRAWRENRSSGGGVRVLSAVYGTETAGSCKFYVRYILPPPEEHTAEEVRGTVPSPTAPSGSCCCSSGGGRGRSD